MAKILFMVDIEEGHLFPSFALAESLKVNGHAVVYTSIPDNEQYILDAGYIFYPLFNTQYPKGFRESYKQKKKEKGPHHTINVVDHIEELMLPAFSDFLEMIKPDIIIMSCFLHVESLILYYKNKIKPVFFRPYLREPGADMISDGIKDIVHLPAESVLRLFDFVAGMGYSFTSFAELLSPAESFYELVICSDKLELPGFKKGINTTYIGSGIDLARYTGKIPVPVNNHSRIIYASMGSQAIAYRDKFKLFFEGLVSLMSRQAMKEFHLVISIGYENSMEEFKSGLPNITVLNWVSQVDILKVATAALVHGGLGTIKECILHAVPMIVFPVTHDQPSNGKRIEYYKLGKVADFNNLRADLLEADILEIIASDTIMKNLADMRNAFIDLDKSNVGLNIIESLLPRKGITI
jgi:zeaxanthin glucosyltransferase